MRVMPMRLNNAFGLCSYLVSPQGARSFLSLFPLDNRPVRIPANRAKFGRDDFRCTTIDMATNTLYPHMSAYVAIPPLALPLNDKSTSSTRHNLSPQQGDRPAPNNSVSATEVPMQRSRVPADRRSRQAGHKHAAKAFVKSVARRFGYEIHRIAPPPSAALIKFMNAPEALAEFDFGDAHLPKRPRQFGDTGDSAQATRRIIIEGWQHLPHSYAMVNQWQLLSLSRRKDVALKLIDAPFYDPRWERQDGIFEPDEEQVLGSIDHAAPDEDADLMLRTLVSHGFCVFACRPDRGIRHFGTSSPSKNPLQGFSRFPEVSAASRSRFRRKGRHAVTLVGRRVLQVRLQAGPGCYCAAWRRYRNIPSHARPSRSCPHRTFACARRFCVFVGRRRNTEQGNRFAVAGVCPGQSKIPPCTACPEGAESALSIPGSPAQNPAAIATWRTAKRHRQGTILWKMFFEQGNGPALSGRQFLCFSLSGRGLQHSRVGGCRLRRPRYLHGWRRDR